MLSHLPIGVILLLAMSFHASSFGAASTATPIKHVIIIMQENHSFDNYFGTYPTANGTLVNDITSQLQKVDGIPNGVCLPYGASCLSPYPANEDNTPNPVEGQLVYEKDYNNGKVDGFPRNSGPQSMAYFNYFQVAAYWDYAEEYGLGDNYYATVMSTTTPNRLLLFAGDTPVSQNYGPPPYVQYGDTVLNQLSARDISWGYFDSLKSSDQVSNLYPIKYLTGIGPEALAHVQDLSAFSQSLSRGEGLPSVSFVMTLAQTEFDEVPPENVTAGELWTVSVVNEVMESAYWDSSAVFITWDEGGGYYDHVLPPHNLTIDHGFDNSLHGYGQRVGLLVISPYSKENYVSRTLLNHMSLLRFIDANWNLPSLNENVANSNNLLDFFEFSQPSRPPIILGTNGLFSARNYPIAIQIPFSQLPYSRTGSLEQGSSQTPSATPIFTIEIAVAVVATFVVLAIAVKIASRQRSTRHRSRLNQKHVRQSAISSPEI